MHTWHVACQTGECKGVTVCSGLGTGPVPYYTAHHVVARHRQQLAPPVTISGWGVGGSRVHMGSLEGCLAVHMPTHSHRWRWARVQAPRIATRVRVRSGGLQHPSPAAYDARHHSHWPRWSQSPAQETVHTSSSLAAKTCSTPPNVHRNWSSVEGSQDHVKPRKGHMGCILTLHLRYWRAGAVERPSCHRFGGWRQWLVHRTELQCGAPRRRHLCRVSPRHRDCRGGAKRRLLKENSARFSTSCQKVAALIDQYFLLRIFLM